MKKASELNGMIALFLGKSDLIFTKCKRLTINETFEPIWISSLDATYWIYGLSTIQRVTVQCQEIGSPRTKGTGIYRISFPYVYAGSFKLLPYSIGKTIVSLARTHIVLPVTDNMLTFLKEPVLQFKPSSLLNFQRLNEISTRVAFRSHMIGAEVLQIINALQNAGVECNTITMIWPWVVGIMNVSMIIDSLRPIWPKFFFLNFVTFTYKHNCVHPHNQR